MNEIDKYRGKCKVCVHEWLERVESWFLGEMKGVFECSLYRRDRPVESADHSSWSLREPLLFITLRLIALGVPDGRSGPGKINWVYYVRRCCCYWSASASALNRQEHAI